MNPTTSTQRDLYQPTVEGNDWLWYNIPVCRQYAGQWVVAIPGEVVAAGLDPKLVLQEATVKLGLQAEDTDRILISAINDPDFEPHYD
jgi:hypothetical protein